MEARVLNIKNPRNAYFLETHWNYFFSVCWVIQGCLMIYAAQLPRGYGFFLMVSSIIAAYGTWFYYENFSKKHYIVHLTIGMLALGNIGMIMGWMADYGFGPLVKEGACLCGCPISPIGEGLLSKFGWMYKGMIIMSLPVFFIIKPIKLSEGDQRKEDVCYGSHSRMVTVLHHILCLGGMVIGMYGACKLLSFFVVVNPFLHFIYTYGLMTLGMSAGMVLPCYIFQCKNRL